MYNSIELSATLQPQGGIQEAVWSSVTGTRSPRPRLTHQRDSANEEVYVIRGLKTDLLGLPAISSLHLVKRLCETVAAEPDARTQEIQKQFPMVFNGLGTMGGKYVIKKEESHPYAIYAPRNVPIPLRPKVQEELNRMEEIGVIQKVSQPTPWCAGMVMVPKKSGSIRICVDLKPLNDSVLREVYPIPKVDDILAQLAGAKVFSKFRVCNVKNQPPSFGKLTFIPCRTPWYLNKRTLKVQILQLVWQKCSQGQRLS